jgi:uncharacterized membrane protein
VRADWSVCNNTDQTVVTAIAYNRSDGVQISQGWWVISPSSCQVVYHGHLQGGYLHVHSSGGGAWGGKYAFCVDDRKFLFDGSATNRCHGGASGYRLADFFDYRWNGPDHTTNLNPAPGSRRSGKL